MKSKENEKNNKLIILDKKNQFVIIYDSIYKNKDLSLEEIGALVKLLSNAPDFTPTIRKCAFIWNKAPGTTNKIIKGLQDKGYLKIENHGKNGAIWTLSQEPQIDLSKNLNEDYLLELFIENHIGYKELDKLVKNKYITRQTALNVINRINDILKTNWLNDDEE